MIDLRRTAWLGGSAAVLAALAAPVAVQAQPGTYSFDIPSQDMAAALRAFGQAARQQIVFDGAEVRGKRSAALRGSYAPDQGLERLLAGSGLVASRRSGVLVVRPFREGANASVSVGANDAEAARLGGDASEVDALTVTGTRIRGAGRGPSPVYALDREDFAEQGADTVQEVLRNVPQNFTGGASEQAAAISSTRNGGNTNLGYGAGVNLRGLGTESTLVLLNGRRLAPGGLGNFVDISTIPLSAIARVEVVADGASAIYGSDAVGGVVNFVLRDNFDGAESRVRYASVTNGSLRQFSASQLFGRTWSSGSVLINLDYGKNDPLLASERPYALGLQGGVTYLSPRNERKGLLVSGHQDLTARLRLNLQAYANKRDADGSVFQTTGRQSNFGGTTKQVGGTLSADWRLGDDWTLGLAYSEDRNATHRVNNLGATPTLAFSRTEVRTKHAVKSGEFEAQGELFVLPGGAARLAFGAERREESLKARRVNLSGGPFAPLERDVTAGYAELFVPLVGEANAVPLVDRLNVTVAGRYEDYSDVGAADTYKLGALWSPVEGVDLRATWGTSFRAPYLYQYDASFSQGVIQTVTFAPSPPVRLAYILNAPAPGLGPETATTWSAGFDIDQDVLGLRVSATYFDIEYEDRIRAASPAGNVFTNASVSALVSVPPNPEVLAAVAQATTVFNLSGQPLSAAQATFDGRVRNQGFTKVSGVDVTVERAFKTGWGAFNAGVDATYLNTFEASATRTAPLVSILDTIYNPSDLRVRGHLTWSRGGWSAAAYLNYTDNYVDNQVLAAPVKVSSWTTVDLGLGYRFNQSPPWLGGLSIRANAQNVFDKDPPRILDRGSSYGNPGYDTENANPLGRIVSVTVAKTW